MHTATMSAPRTATVDDRDDAPGLLARAAGGDPAAWSALTRRYSPLLWSRVHQYRLQEADGFDAVQTTWLRLAENVHRIHTPEHLAGWLATVVSRECLRILRQDARTAPAEEVVLAAVEPSAGPEQIVVDAVVGGALWAAVAELPPQRRALVGALFGDDHRPYAEVADELGMPVGSLGPTRARALAELRRNLRARGIVVPR